MPEKQQLDSDVIAVTLLWYGHSAQRKQATMAPLRIQPASETSQSEGGNLAPVETVWLGGPPQFWIRTTQQFSKLGAIRMAGSCSPQVPG